jgi:glycosyltransferase involved in cell wall biosynthesis
MSLPYPSISCICITNNRPLLLQRAISCFAAQNYINKELVISYPKNDDQTPMVINHVLQQIKLNILRVERNDDETVGNARNKAIAECSGDYICIWDDDDWYHGSRLSYQYNSMQTTGQAYQASILTKLLLYDSISGKAYLSFPYTWDGSLMCRKEIIFQNQYAHRDKGEDTHIIKFLDARKILHHIDTVPFLYVYIYHGGNTWNYAHFEYFINKSEVLDEETTNTIKGLINLD